MKKEVKPVIAGLLTDWWMLVLDVSVVWVIMELV